MDEHKEALREIMKYPKAKKDKGGVNQYSAI
jgi:hypothetical protein